jgi:FtsH-binding integral membrane protein
MKDIKTFLNTRFGLQHWPFGNGWGFISIVAIIVPSLSVGLRGKWVCDPSMSIIIMFAIAPLLIISTCKDHKKLQNIYIAAAWGVILLIAMTSCGSFFLPYVLEITHFSLKSAMLLMLGMSPFLYIVCLWTLHYHKKTLIKRENEKLSRPSESHET